MANFLSRLRWGRRPAEAPAADPLAAQRLHLRSMQTLASDADDWHPVAYYGMALFLMVVSMGACVVSMETAAISSENEQRILWGFATISGATAVVMIAAKFSLAFVSAALPPGKSGFVRGEAFIVAFGLLLLVCTQGQIGRSKIEVATQDGEDRYALRIETLKGEIAAREKQISERRASADKLAGQGYSWSVGQAKQMSIATDRMEAELPGLRAKLSAAIEKAPKGVSTKRALKSEEAAGWSTLLMSCATEILSATCAHVAGLLWSLGRRARFVRRGRLPLPPAPLAIVPSEAAPDRTDSGDTVRSDGTDGTVGTVPGTVPGAVLGTVLGTVGAGAGAGEPPAAPVLPTAPVAAEVVPSVVTPTVPGGWTYTPLADRTVPTVPGTVPTVPTPEEQARRVIKSNRGNDAAPSFPRKPAPATPVQADQKALTKLAKDAAKDESEKLRAWALDSVLAGVKPSVSKLQDHRRATVGAPGSRDLIAESLRWMTSEGWIEKGGRDNVLTAKARAEQARRGLKV